MAVLYSFVKQKTDAIPKDPSTFFGSDWFDFSPVSNTSTSHSSHLKRHQGELMASSNNTTCAFLSCSVSFYSVKPSRCLTLNLYSVSGSSSLTSVLFLMDLWDIQSRPTSSLYSTCQQANTQSKANYNLSSVWEHTSVNFTTVSVTIKII